MPAELIGVRRRHRCYTQLLALCLAVMVTFALPEGLFRLLGLAAFLSSLVWTLTPVFMRGTGVPMLVLWVPLWAGAACG